MIKLVNKLNKIWPIIVLLLLGLFAVRTFFQGGYFDGHDAQAHLVRLYQFDLALNDGQFLPAWAGDLYAGKGYPVFIFVYPLPYLVAEGFHLTGFDLAAALKATFIISYLATALTMYWFGAFYWRSKLAGFIAGLLMTWAPYVFVKMFVTASLGELMAFVFVPLIFLFSYQLLIRKKSSDVIGLALSLAGIILSHLITLIVISPLLVLFIFWHGGLKKIKPFIISGLLALGLSAFYLLPAILELPFTHFSDAVQNQYALQFVELKRLLYSTWGTDAPGWGNNPLSQQVGLVQWLAVGLSLLLGWKLKKLWPFIFGFGLSIFLMLPISKFVWDLVLPLQAVNTPWRFLSLAVFSATVAAGFLATIKGNWRYLILAMLAVLAIYGNRNHLRINERVDYSSEWLQSYTGVATGWNEHLPIWVSEVNFEPSEAKAETVRGECEVIPVEQKSNRKTFSLNCAGQSIIQLNTLYYPGWKVRVDGGNEVTGEVLERLEESNGLMRFTTDSGQHKLEAEFTKTPLRQLAYFLTLLTIAVTAWITSSTSRKLIWG